MGLRFRKSFKLAPGLRLNMSGSGCSVGTWAPVEPPLIWGDGASAAILTYLATFPSKAGVINPLVRPDLNPLPMNR